MNQPIDSLDNLDHPDYIFEVSWEVCNKIGGIYTVIATKAPVLAALMDREDQLIMVGPDVWKETTDHPYFDEDLQLMKSWREYAAHEGLYFRIGRWKIEGAPLTILVDFTSFFPKKDEIFAHLWEKYSLDSISGQWDYVEPAMFGYAAARVIESYYRTHLSSGDKVLAQFHEWMTGTGILHLREKTPGIATAFTTHATVLGRSLAGNGRPLYSTLETVSPDYLSAEFQVKSKHSLEKLAAENCDVFTTVSGITATECTHLLGKTPDLITPNGFDEALVPDQAKRLVARESARKQIFNALEPLFGTHFPDDTLLVLNSGRYEFRNKGIDLFIDAIGNMVARPANTRKVVAVIAVPAYHHGPRPDLVQKMQGIDVPMNQAHHALTHLLNNPENDPVLARINSRNISNAADGNVFLCFAPTYLTGEDGIFGLSYYDFLCGFDITLFPSYYEPWGYTPLESIAFGIPTATTSLAGFGRWIQDTLHFAGKSIQVIPRNDFQEEDVVRGLETYIGQVLSLGKKEYEEWAHECLQVSQLASWKLFIRHYLMGYQQATALASKRAFDDPYLLSNGHKQFLSKEKEHPIWSKVLVKASYPPELDKLKRLSDNLWWSWNCDATDLFRGINPTLWESSGNNPIKLLGMLNFKDLKELANDQVFISRLEGIFDRFEVYLHEKPEENLPEVAYFSMEFGLHESLKIYSGGLGILAGDYMKEASDDNKRITGVGLLYRYGYFTQRITPYGDQEAGYIPQKFSELPIHPLRDEHGDWLTISIAFPGRNVYAKVWRVDIGRARLFLLDADIERNAPHDRVITHQLYGGDLENRFKQEMLLGVGGIRLLERLGIEPDLYHCNEGHAAFLNFERIRDLVQKNFLTFGEALEVVRSSTLFTTHTPVPAGHDLFPEELLRAYIAHYPERLHITWDELMSLGREDGGNFNAPFSMSLLAINTSQEVNGVSEVHGEVSRAMFKYLYDGYFQEELHIGYVTNGVHYQSWTNPRWQSIHKQFLSANNFSDQHEPEPWKGIDAVPDDVIWDTRNQLRGELLNHMIKREGSELTKRQESPGYIVRVLESLEQPWLTIGFARRFATYKRAHLIFSNEERLAQLVNNRKRPIRFVFAGKAHPKDKAGQDLIKKIIEVSRKPTFEGKIIFIENYDMELGRYLTQGCDIWMNTPTRPQEASGTSGEKAIMNGVLNLSVLDGWWAEGYKPEAGWALPKERAYTDQSLQDQLDAETIYNLLEEKITPLFYERSKEGIAQGWVKYIRNNFKEITPHFTMKRMMHDYHRQYYYKLTERHRLLLKDDFRNARMLASWKRRVMMHWDNIALLEKSTPDSTISPLNLGENFKASVTLYAPGFGPDDLGVEVIFGEKIQDEVKNIFYKQRLTVTVLGNGKLRFDCTVPTTRAGVFDYAFRLFPDHPLLEYRMAFPLVKWI